MVLPPFTADGVLPPGEYLLTLEELRGSHLVTGSGEKPWDRDHRSGLVENLAVLVRHLIAVGIVEVFVDGSFVEDRAKPGDIDGYFVVPSARDFYTGVLEARLVQHDPAWTWDPYSRILDPASGKRKIPMWHKYRVELFPHVPRLPTGIPDEFGNDMEFPAAFRKTKEREDGRRLPKGIVKLGGLR